ncbi:hypothetical protein QX249_24635 [Vibrio parahaemolyticus]|uniref:Uncharacterized protein n=1 Tax=Vibrio parahaemolyticus TaxID=670 RepID=A0AAW8Q5Y1_VIBPH|nr:hypothetical protein [Vibrio parahaemolyticus]MDS1823832.1 hypothetical protein [Vibrio parahaemolyticus]
MDNKSETTFLRAAGKYPATSRSRRNVAATITGCIATSTLNTILKPIAVATSINIDLIASEPSSKFCICFSIIGFLSWSDVSAESPKPDLSMPISPYPSFSKTGFSAEPALAETADEEAFSDTDTSIALAQADENKRLKAKREPMSIFFIIFDN